MRAARYTHDAMAELAVVLDFVWRTPPSSRFAQAPEYADQLDPSAITELAAWDVAATLGLAPGGLELVDERRFLVSSGSGAHFKGHVESETGQTRAPMIVYEDQGLRVVLDQPQTDQDAPYFHSLSSLLLVAQWARDRVDTLTFWPASEREKAFGTFSSQVGVASDRLLSLIAWVPELNLGSATVSAKG